MDEAERASERILKGPDHPAAGAAFYQQAELHRLRGESTVFLVLSRAPAAPFVPEPWHGRRICAMAVCYTGDLDHVDEALAPIRVLGDPVVDLLGAQPYTQV
jgi:hypothetical protein